jgi:hypothetical protein
MGDVFIADTENNRIREVLPTGTIVTVAGNGQCSPRHAHGDDQSRALLGDGGPAVKAFLCDPWGVAVDGSGNLFIADTGHHEIRIVDKAGTINTYGNGDPTRAARGDDQGDEADGAALGAPVSLSLDANHNLFIADAADNVVREITPNQVMKTVAGTGRPGFSGDGGPAIDARLRLPTGVAVDQSGNLFITDTRNQRLREVGIDGKIETVAGTGMRGFSGDGGPANQAELNFPSGAPAVDGTAIYFADTLNQRVRGVFTGPPPVLPESPLAILLPLIFLVVAGGAYGVARKRRRRMPEEGHSGDSTTA